MSDSEMLEPGRRARLDLAMAEYLMDADAGRAPRARHFCAIPTSATNWRPSSWTKQTSSA